MIFIQTSSISLKYVRFNEKVSTWIWFIYFKCKKALQGVVTMPLSHFYAITQVSYLDIGIARGYTRPHSPFLHDNFISFTLYAALNSFLAAFNFVFLSLSLPLNHSGKVKQQQQPVMLGVTLKSWLDVIFYFFSWLPSTKNIFFIESFRYGTWIWLMMMIIIIFIALDQSN